MKLVDAIIRMNDCLEETNKYGVKYHIYTSWSETRPLKTFKGAKKRIKQWDRYGLWDGCCYIRYVGKNGKEYKTALNASKH